MKQNLVFYSYKMSLKELTPKTLKTLDTGLSIFFAFKSYKRYVNSCKYNNNVHNEKSIVKVTKKSCFEQILMKLLVRFEYNLFLLIIFFIFGTNTTAQKQTSPSAAMKRNAKEFDCALTTRPIENYLPKEEKLALP